MALNLVKIRKKPALYAVLVAGLVIILSAAWLFNMNSRPSSAAADLSKFDPGNIISDSTMSDRNTMSKKQIQSFLKSKGDCRSTGNGYINTLTKTKDGKQAYLKSGGKTWTWNIKNGHFICMAEDKFNGETAANIFYRAAQDYKINPQVLLAMIQKESSLITDGFPNDQNYNIAMGFGCPDTGPNNTANCSKKYFGLKNQVRQAAALFREVLNGGWTNYPVGVNRIQYNPKASCGTQKVNIKNRATSSLYRYTPYVPNKSALNAGYGTGDSCAAYGNRNFYLFFNDWFGDPTKGEYNYKFENLAGTTKPVNKVSSKNLGNHVETVTDGDKIYTLYRDETNKTLRLAYWNGSKWTDKVLDGKGAKTKGSVANNVGKYISATKWKKQIQVFYYDSTAKALRHAWLRGGVWRSEALDGDTNGINKNKNKVGKSTEVISWKGQIQVFYRDESGQNIRHAWWRGDGRWRFETLDGIKRSATGKTGNLGGNGRNIEAIVWRDQIQLFYYDAGSEALRHVWWPNDGRWHSETMDGTKKSVIGNSSNMGTNVTATVYKDQIQLFYHDATNGSLRHTWWPNDGRWHSELMDGNTDGKKDSLLGNDINAGKRSVAKAFDNKIYLFYYDNAAGFSHNSAWRLAYWQSGRWNQVLLDGGNKSSKSGSSSAVYTDLSFDLYDKKSMQIFYKGSGGNLRHSWFKY